MGFLDFLGDVGHTIWGIWTLDPTLAEWYRQQPYAREIAITIAVLAGASTLLGNSVVLFLNRIRGWRFGVSLLLNGLGMVALYVVQAAIIAAVGFGVTGERVGPPAAIYAVMLATAPMILGFFELVPYMGPGIGHLLQAWGVAALWLVVTVLYDLDIWTALWITLVGWGVMQLISWLLARPLSWLGNKVWQRLSGRSTLITARDILSGQQFMPVEWDFQIATKTEGGE